MIWAMEISTTYLTTPKLIVRGHRACHPVLTWVQRVLPIFFVVGGVLTQDPVPILLGAAYWAFCYVMQRRALKPHSVPEHTATITITAHDYTDHCSVATGIRPWSSFKSVKRVGDFWVLKFAGGCPMFLPRAALDDAQAAAFEDFLAGLGRMKPADLPAVEPEGSTPYDGVPGRSPEHLG